MGTHEVPTGYPTGYAGSWVEKIKLLPTHGCPMGRGPMGSGYPCRTLKRPRAIFKVREKGLEYNYKLLATILVIEDTWLEKQIKANYTNNSFIVTIIKKLGDDFIIDNQGIL